MPKSRTVYSYLDKSLQINIKDVQKLLVKGCNKGLHWQWPNGSNILMHLNYQGDQPVMKLLYSVNGESIQLTVFIVAKPSNLGKGNVWYFICPVSGLHCRILYDVQSKFVHRKAYPGQHYYMQVHSKTNRLIESLLPRQEAAIEKCKPHTLREWYAGRWTKRYIRYIKVQMKYNRMWKAVGDNVLERLMKD